MRKGLFFRMAAVNIRKNRQTYVPFILTCVGTSALYYILGALTVSGNVAGMVGGGTMQMFLNLGKWIIGIFSVIFLFYTNSFLLKRRKKEFGLYNILGLEKSHVALLLLLENFYTAVISIAFGIFTGLLLYKGVFLLLARLLHNEVTLGFEVAWPIIRETAILFGLIFLLLYAHGFRQIRCSEPIELLKGGQVGEREPKTRWLLSVVGFVCLGLGYYLAVVIESPIEAVLMFFVAVILVIVGTYFLFIAGSIFVLKLMRKNKRYYYKAKHFTAVSGMIYRMKQNAAGLASICIMSTAVLLCLSTTACLYFGMTDILHTRYPRDLSLTIRYVEDGGVDKIRRTVEETAGRFGASIKNEESYLYQHMYVSQSGNELLTREDSGGSLTDFADIYLLGLEEYEQITGEEWELLPDEVLLQTVHGTAGEAPKGEMVLDGRTWKIKDEVSGLDSPKSQLVLMENCYYVVFPTIEDVETVYRASEGIGEEEAITWGYYCSFDLNIDKESQKDMEQALEQALFGGDSSYAGYAESAAADEEEFIVLYGGLFFIGIFLGLIFLMATVLIIYYKQVTEGYEDHDRFVIMQKVGMDKQEVRRSINSQIRTVFLLPVIMAGIHIIFAYPMMSRILMLLSLTNQNLFMVTVLITFLIFLLFYWVVYSLTAKTYYRLVRW